MILAELQIEHFKQYGERQTIDIPEQGVIAIIGVNGAGKTTLFEAIEWCLYSPRRLSRTEIWPRGGVNRPRVTVVLQAREAGERYRVERWLTAKGVEAAIYRDNDDETPIVQGAREVTQYVERTLIGLSHGAFVSTFFTRQKELSFFGSDKPADRRREVAKLLGHDAIKTAQELIASDRKNAEAGAISQAQQYERELAGRDLAAETADAAGRVVTAERIEATTAETLDQVRTVLATAEAELNFHRDKERADAALRHDLERIHGDARAAAARREAVMESIAALDQAAGQRAILAPIAAQADQRRVVLESHDAALDRRRAGERFRDRLEQVARDQSNHRQRLTSIVHEHSGAGLLDDWQWSPDGDEQLDAAVTRLLNALTGFDPQPHVQRAAALEHCVETRRLLNQTIETEENYQRRRRDYERQVEAIRASGDPRAEQLTARTVLAANQEAAAVAGARAASELAARQRYLDLITRLEQLHSEEPCPTCQRPFHGPDEIAATVRTLQSDAGRHASEAEAARQEQDRGRKMAERARADEAAAAKRLDDLVQAEKGIINSEPYLIDQKHKREEATLAFQSALRAARLAEAPNQAEIEAATRRATAAQRLVNAGLPLRQLQTGITESARVQAETTRHLLALGADDYDRTAHLAARKALDEAKAAVAQISQIDRQLLARQNYEATLDAAGLALRAAETARVQLEEARAELAFDPGAFEQARQAGIDAVARERAAGDALANARQARMLAASERTRLEREAARLNELQTRAISRRREADDLQRMQREFTEFDRYVADKVAPVLAERTGEFLTEMTDGRYSRVEFDHDYGLRVYDGEEAFPVSEFSGGERDVASLSARLALSTVIGGQAVDPPRFIVLDEVFGSLDQERRSLVLEMLGKLAAESLPLNQLFIISHVEDVNASPVVDEVWQVRDAGGASEIRRGGGPEGLQAL